jgi:hypothetical protein
MPFKKSCSNKCQHFQIKTSSGKTQKLTQKEIDVIFDGEVYGICWGIPRFSLKGTDEDGEINDFLDSFFADQKQKTMVLVYDRFV